MILKRLCGSYGGFPNEGPLFGKPYNKDHSISGSILGSPILGNSHIILQL